MKDNTDFGFDPDKTYTKAELDALLARQLSAELEDIHVSEELIQSTLQRVAEQEKRQAQKSVEENAAGVSDGRKKAIFGNRAWKGMLAVAAGFAVIVLGIQFVNLGRGASKESARDTQLSYSESVKDAANMEAEPGGAYDDEISMDTDAAYGGLMQGIKEEETASAEISADGTQESQKDWTYGDKAEEDNSYNGTDSAAECPEASDDIFGWYEEEVMEELTEYVRTGEVCGTDISEVFKCRGDTEGSADEAFRYLWWNEGESTVHCYVSRNGTVELYLEGTGEIRYRECTNYAEAALLWEMAGE